MKENDLKNVLNHIVELQEVLDERLFNSDETLKDDVRSGLMAIVNKVIENTVAKINGLEISDIYLVGSASNYWYHEKSDIDIRVEVVNKKCSYIVKDNKHMDMFLSMKTGALREKGYKFYFRDRLVDIKLASEKVHFISMYSIKNNCWFVHPEKQLFKKVNSIEMLEKYRKYKEDLEKKYSDLTKQYRGEDLARRLNNLYLETITPCITGKPQIMDCILFKLLSHDGSLQKIASQSIQVYNEALSMNL